jgi:hypothetical protein
MSCYEPRCGYTNSSTYPLVIPTGSTSGYFAYSRTPSAYDFIAVAPTRKFFNLVIRDIPYTWQRWYDIFRTPLFVVLKKLPILIQDNIRYKQERFPIMQRRQQKRRHYLQKLSRI